MGKYIETALPLAEINDAAIREKAGKRGHSRKPSYVVGAQPGSVLPRCFGCCCNGFHSRDFGARFGIDCKDRLRR